MREVRDLGGASDVGRGGQQEILKDGAKQRVGAQALGGGVEDGEEILGGVRLLPCRPMFARFLRLRARRAPVSSSMKEEQAGRGRDQNLGVVATLFEQLAAFEESGFEFGGVLDGVAKDGCAEGVKVAGGGVDEDQSLFGEDRREQAGKGLGEGGVGSVGGFDGVEDRAGAEEFSGLIEQRADAGAERDGADGPVVRLVREAQGLQLVARGKNDVVGFVEVVVFGGEPEDGDGAGVFGFADGGRGLEEREEGSAEESDLLAGDDGGGSLPEAGDVFESRGAGVEAAVLGFEQVGDAGADGRVLRGRRSIGGRRGWTGRRA